MTKHELHLILEKDPVQKGYLKISKTSMYTQNNLMFLLIHQNRLGLLNSYWRVYLNFLKGSKLVEKAIKADKEQLDKLILIND